MRQFIDFLFTRGSIPEPVDLRPQDVREWIVDMRRRGLSARSIARHLYSLRSLWRYLLDTEAVSHDPLRRISAPKVSRRLPTYLSAGELRAILDAALKHPMAPCAFRNYAMMSVLIFTGMRRAELIALRMGDIDRDAGVVLIRSGKGGKARALGAVRLAPALFSGLKVIANDAEAIRLRGRKGLTVTVTCDSVLRIDSRRAPLEFTVQGSFAPQFLRVERPGLLALDDVGGFGVYMLPESPRRMSVQQSGKGFSVQEELPAGSTLLVGVCSPREYNWKQHNEERIVHQFPQLEPGLWVTDGNSPRGLPTDEELVAWRQFASVLVLHLEFWDGFGVRHIKPKDVAHWAVRSNARIPYWPGLQVHGGRKYFLDPEEHEVFRNYYLPAANQVKSPTDYAPLAAVSRRELAARQAQLEAEDKAAHQALGDYLKARREEFGASAADNLAAFRLGECQDFVRRRSGPHGVGYPLEYATDQNPETYWGADFLPQWATIDLGKAETVSRIWLQTYFGDKRYYHYRVEVSTDNETWQLVGEKTDNALSIEAGDQYRFAPCQARYVRVTILHNSANNAGHIVELGVYR